MYDIAVRLDVNLPDVEDPAVGVELAKAAHAKGKRGRRARLAETLKGMHK